SGPRSGLTGVAMELWMLARAARSGSSSPDRSTTSSRGRSAGSTSWSGPSGASMKRSDSASASSPARSTAAPNASTSSGPRKSRYCPVLKVGFAGSSRWAYHSPDCASVNGTARMDRSALPLFQQRPQPRHRRRFCNVGKVERNALLVPLHDQVHDPHRIEPAVDQVVVVTDGRGVDFDDGGDVAAQSFLGYRHVRASIIWRVERTTAKQSAACARAASCQLREKSASASAAMNGSISRWNASAAVNAQPICA